MKTRQTKQKSYSLSQKILLRKYISIALLLLFAVFLPQKISADVVFQDSFDNIPGAGDINMSNSIAGRQFGTLAPLSYSGPGVASSLVGDSAPFPGKLYWGPNMISPDYNFTELTGGFTVEFDLLTSEAVSWTGVSIGAEDQNERLNTTKGLGFLFNVQGNYLMFDNGVNVAAFGPETIPSGVFFHVLISVTTESFGGDDDVKVALFIDGKPMNLHNAGAGALNQFTYVRQAPLKSNYIILDSWAEPTSKTTVDNFTISSSASGFYEYNWTNNASSKIDSGKTYSHKINLSDDDDVTINGELFTGSSSNISGVAWSMINGVGDNNFTRGTVANPDITGSGTNLVNDFFMEGYNQSSAIILSNLTPGAMYAMTLYNRGYVGNRTAYFAPGDSESSIVKLNPNLNGNSGILFKHIYTAPSDGVFSMSVTPAETNTDHILYYAFSNELSPPPEPKNISASQGSFVDKTVVNWNSVSGADKYQVWRNDIDSSSSATDISVALSETTFTDTTADVNIDYYYWVKAKNTNGWSDFSLSTLGFSTDSAGPDQPTNVLPTDGAEISDFPLILEGSPFSDGSWTMKSVRWQISDTTNYSSIVWDSGELSTNATSITAPSGLLGLTNFWRVRYENDRNQWSDWSDYTVFLVERDYNSPLYFYETFNNVSGSGDVNKEYYATGRQIGKVVPVDYVSQGITEVGNAAANPDKLTLSGEESSCSPNMSFTKSGCFKIEFDITPSPDGTAICFGKAAKNSAPKSAGGMGIVFYGDGSGRYDVYNSSSLESVITNPAATGSMHIMITAGTEDFENSPANIAMFINEEPMPLNKYWVLQHTNLPDYSEIHWGYSYPFEKANGLNENFVTFYNYDGDAIIDNFSIQEITTNVSVYSWSDDNDIRVDSSRTYTHAYNLSTNNSVVINGVTFDGTDKYQGVFPPNGVPAVTGSNWFFYDPDGYFEEDYLWSAATVHAGAAGYPSGSGKELLRDVLFDKFSGALLSLEVTPNTTNVLTFYKIAWADGGYPFIVAGNDGGAPQTVDMSAFLAGDGITMDYTYIAPDNGIFKIAFGPAMVTIGAFSNYEITNNIPPVLATIDSLDFGEIVQGESLTFQLPVFNIGKGIVSGEISGITAPFSLASGSNYTAQSESPDFVSVTFAPIGDDDYSNSVSFVGSGGTSEVVLKGTGIPEPLSLIIYYLSFVIFYFVRRK